MRYLRSDSFDAQWNLALEEYVFEKLPRDESYFMLWQNRSAVVVGRHQNTWGEVDAEYARKNGIQVVRRLSGGGAVYHDMGNLNFTFVTDAADPGKINFELFCAPVAAVLAEYGVKADVGGRNDITVDGRKFSGNAQYVKKGRVMHHGTILFNSELETVSRVLNPSAEKLESKGIRSVKSRVTNLCEYLPADVTLEEFAARLARYVCGADAAPLTPDAAARSAIDALYKERYSKWEWNWGESPVHDSVRKKRFEGVGTVEAYITASGGIIKSIEFYGDFFVVGSVGDFAESLVGVPLKPDALRNSLSGRPIPINGMSADDLISLIC